MKLLLRYGAPIWVLLFVWLPLGSAQTAPGLRIKKIEIKHIGPPAVSEQLIKSNIRVKEGDPYLRTSVDDDVRNLYTTGYFYNIRVADKIESDGVVLTYILQGKPRLTAIKFEGNKKYSNEKLKKKLTSKEGEPLDERKLFVDSQEIQKMYQKAGYPRTEVKAVPSIDEATGRGTATFQIKESRKVKIKAVAFEGAQAFTQKKLRKQIKTRKHWMFSWITGSGVFKDEQFEDDKEKLAEFYRKEGYIDFEIKEVKLITPSERTMEIHFVIYEGKRYNVGAVAFKGNTVFNTSALTNGLRQLHFFNRRKGKAGAHGLEMDVGDIFTPDGLTKDIEAIEDYYGAQGYIDVKQSTGNLKVTKIPNTETGTMDLEFQIEEGQKSYIEKIEIKGNTKTKDKVIRRELAVSPGEVFNTVRVKLSKQRLENLQFFEKVDTRDEPSDAGPTRKNLTVGVEEKSTGNVTFGAGFSSVDNIVGFVEVTQGNFDLFRPPVFTGGGQKFRLRVQYGAQRQDYVLSFVEPWFLNRKLALSVDLYHRELSFQSLENLYDETRTGMRLGLTRALWSDFLIGGISYTIENVGIVNLARPNRSTDTNGVVTLQDRIPPSIRAEEGNALVSKIGASVAYDTRNSNLLPNKGGRTELLGEVAGGPFGGEKDFYKLELKSTWYFKGFFEGHVLELSGRTGVAGGLQGDPVPFYERWYLGGIDSLRGFRYRSISPRDPGFKEPIGGNTYWLGSAEYSVPIIERLRFALFYDIGAVTADSYDFQFSNYSDNWGLGLRLNLPIGPLRLDYGIPITHDQFNSGTGRFQFSVGYTRPF
ncbi:MAG: outer membrane protein assembly factor BamA [Verrucomicrobia bacterium]|nr:outer membrane protein assembly factor BamA [Verrucomicrobiota bacterium]